MDSVGGLSFRHTLGGLLELHVLLVTEDALVVDQLEGLLLLALGTVVWLLNLPHLNHLRDTRVALVAAEVSALHFRDHV